MHYSHWTTGGVYGPSGGSGHGTVMITRLSPHEELTVGITATLSRPRAFPFQQRDAQRRAETRRGSAGPANGTWSAAAWSCDAIVGPPRYERSRMRDAYEARRIR